MNGKLIARWETSGKKHWYELYETKVKGRLSYHYSGDNCGGNLGYMSKTAAIKQLEKYMDDARRIDNINYKGVFLAMPTLRGR